MDGILNWEIVVEGCMLWMVDWWNFMASGSAEPCVIEFWCWSRHLSKVYWCQLRHLLYHFDHRFSHMSQATVNWTSTVFHSGSQLAVNFISNQDTIFSVPFRPFWGQNWTYFAFCHTNFCPWTWSNSVHSRHRSHPVNLRLKWYSMCDDELSFWMWWWCRLLPKIFSSLESLDMDTRCMSALGCGHQGSVLECELVWSLCWWLCS